MFWKRGSIFLPIFAKIVKLVVISIKRGSIHDLLKLAWGNMQKMNLKNVLIKHKLLIKWTCWLLNLHFIEHTNFIRKG